MIFKKHKVSINKNYIYQIFWNNRITYKKAQKQKYPYDLNKFASAKETLRQNINLIENDIISIDETGIVVKRIDDSVGLKVVQNVQLMNRIIMNQVTQCVWQSVKIVTFYIDCSEEPLMDLNIEINFSIK